MIELLGESYDMIKELLEEIEDKTQKESDSLLEAKKLLDEINEELYKSI
tara:strand:+ start:335 stop:481 length:147 start_codon:yes stop_codon:yes gene_type:complete